MLAPSLPPPHLMQKFGRFYILSFLVVLPTPASLLSSAAEVIKRCQGSSRRGNLGPVYGINKVTCLNTSHACGVSLLPPCVQRGETSCLCRLLGSSTTQRAWGVLRLRKVKSKTEQPAHTETERFYSPWPLRGNFV